MQPIGKFRNVIELSSMINNDECVVYTDTQLEDLKGVKVECGYLDDPFLVISRPVYDAEVEQGLVLKNQRLGPDQAKEPDITHALDAMYTLHAFMSFRVNTLKVDPASAVVDFVAYHFYDCMSGGCSQYALAMCRELIERHDIPRDMDVYPRGEDGWNTVKDFLEEIKNVPRFSPQLQEVAKLFLPRGAT